MIMKCQREMLIKYIVEMNVCEKTNKDSQWLAIFKSNDFHSGKTKTMHFIKCTQGANSYSFDMSDILNYDNKNKTKQMSWQFRKPCDILLLFQNWNHSTHETDVDTFTQSEKYSVSLFLFAFYSTLHL